MPASNAYYPSKLLQLFDHSDKSISRFVSCSPSPHPPRKHCGEVSPSHTMPSLWAPVPPSYFPAALSALFPIWHQKQGSLLWEQSSCKSLFIFLEVNLRLRKGSGMTTLGTKAHLETWIMWNLSLHGFPHKTNYNIILSENFCQIFMGSPESYILSENCTDLYRG